MGEFIAGIGQYWWLIFIVGPMVGGWIGGVAKYNERKRRDRIELERVRRGGGSQEGGSASAPAWQQSAVAPSKSVTDRDIERVLGEHDAATSRWLSYELDVAKLIDYPLMTDMREQLTRDFHSAKRRADSLRPDDQTVLKDPARLNAYRDAVHDFATSFDVAVTEARRRAQGDFSPAERERLSTARKLVGIAVDEAATPAERQSAYKRARRELDGLIVLPDATTDDIEHRIAGAIER